VFINIKNVRARGFNRRTVKASRLKCQRRNKLERTALLSLSINQSKDAFMVKLAEQNSNQRL